MRKELRGQKVQLYISIEGGKSGASVVRRPRGGLQYWGSARREWEWVRREGTHLMAPGAMDGRQSVTGCGCSNGTVLVSDGHRAAHQVVCVCCTLPDGFTQAIDQQDTLSIYLSIYLSTAGTTGTQLALNWHSMGSFAPSRTAVCWPIADSAATGQRLQCTISPIGVCQKSFSVHTITSAFEHYPRYLVVVCILWYYGKV